MFYCENCGAQQKEGVPYCTVCGYTLDKNSAVNAAPKYNAGELEEMTPQKGDGPIGTVNSKGFHVCERDMRLKTNEMKLIAVTGIALIAYGVFCLVMNIVTVSVCKKFGVSFNFGAVIPAVVTAVFAAYLMKYNKWAAIISIFARSLEVIIILFDIASLFSKKFKSVSALPSDAVLQLKTERSTFTVGEFKRAMTYCAVVDIIQLVLAVGLIVLLIMCVKFLTNGRKFERKDI